MRTNNNFKLNDNSVANLDAKFRHLPFHLGIRGGNIEIITLGPIGKLFSTDHHHPPFELSSPNYRHPRYWYEINDIKCRS